MNKYVLSKYNSLLFLILFTCISNDAFNQLISYERKKIQGMWISEEGNWSFKFDANMKCIEYIDGKLQASYIYKITSGNSVCGRERKVDLKDTLVSFLQLEDVKSHERTCYEINGVSDLTLSIMGYKEPTLFNRKTVKQQPGKDGK